MKERVLIKQNVFTSVMFGAVFLFILFESGYYQDNLSKIAFVISIPIFILSLIKIGIDISEDINDSITSRLNGYEEYQFNYVGIFYDTLEQIKNSNEHDLKDTIESIVSEKPDSECYKKDLFDYYHLTKYREIIRSIRRLFLYVYYALLMIVLTLLLLHSELYQMLDNVKWFASINMNSFTLWSLIVLLFEIMMKDMVEDIIYVAIHKFIGLDL